MLIVNTKIADYFGDNEPDTELLSVTERFYKELRSLKESRRPWMTPR
ncbi:hypothetical protein D9758_003684 [Tetrapyrgos nigripes]|uniref:Uncharacterized protein n=1 Tax=Tetrapyrgos nigripes TaxID=182062 RepID=A0A8H5GLT8_9AGAR|nr:hypothetical protein D9758_003684 [Tetrapyrgos nigripes]